MPSPSKEIDSPPLSQYGFGADLDFDSLVRTNRFLFRVYTPKQRSPFTDASDPYFVAAGLDEQFTASPPQFSRSQSESSSIPISESASYEDVVAHMGWTTKASSHYISTSFSFIWSIWEALRRHHQGMKKDVEIAIIDGLALTGQAATAVQLLRKGQPKEHSREYWKWYSFAQESQSVLVHEYIPGSAVLASVPLFNVLEKLPSYLLLSEPPSLRENPLAFIAWDFTKKRPSFRQFCQQMTTRFLQLTPEDKLKDSTTGSVRLALAFLRPWFHEQVISNDEAAIATLCSFAFVISQWPGHAWSVEHPELQDLVSGMVRAIADEIREEKRHLVVAEVSRLQGVIHGLEQAVEEFETRLAAQDRKLGKRASLPLATSLHTPPMTPPTQTAPDLADEEEHVHSGNSSPATLVTSLPSPHLSEKDLPEDEDQTLVFDNVYAKSSNGEGISSLYEGTSHNRSFIFPGALLSSSESPLEEFTIPWLSALDTITRDIFPIVEVDEPMTATKTKPSLPGAFGDSQPETPVSTLAAEVLPLRLKEVVFTKPPLDEETSTSDVLGHSEPPFDGTDVQLASSESTETIGPEVEVSEQEDITLVQESELKPDFISISPVVEESEPVLEIPELPLEEIAIVASRSEPTVELEDLPLHLSAPPTPTTEIATPIAFETSDIPKPEVTCQPRVSTAVPVFIDVDTTTATTITPVVILPKSSFDCESEPESESESESDTTTQSLESSSSSSRTTASSSSSSSSATPHVDYSDFSDLRRPVPSTTTNHHKKKPPTLLESASCVATAFFIGAFITLTIMAPTRRSLLHMV